MTAQQHQTEQTAQLTPTSPQRWYLLQCKPNQQQRALMNLHNQGIDCFNPTHPVQRKTRGGRLATVREALFPNYLFVPLEEHCNWLSINATRGVSRVVSFGGQPLPVPGHVMQLLQQRMQQQSGDSQEESAEPLFKAGDRVTITEGAFRDTEAIVAASNGEERVCLLIELIQRQHRLEVPLSSVAAR